MTAAMNQPDTPFRATFKRMDESTAEEWAHIEAQHDGLIDALPDRILDQLRLLESDAGGFAVDRLTHSLQTAHRAEIDGRGRRVSRRAHCSMTSATCSDLATTPTSRQPS